MSIYIYMYIYARIYTRNFHPRTSACYYYYIRLRSGRRAVQRVCFGYDDEFEYQLNEAMKQSAICASDRLRLGVSVEDNADAADDDDGEDEEDTVSVD